MCKHNIIGIKNSDKVFMEQNGFYLFENNKEIDYYAKRTCDCSSFVGLLADYKGTLDDYICESEKKKNRIFAYVKSAEYNARKKEYIEKYNMYLEKENAFTVPISQLEEKMMDDIWDKQLSDEEEALEEAKVRRLIEGRYKELKENEEYLKARKQLEEHISQNQELLDMFTYEAQEQIKEESEDLKSRVMAEYEGYLNDIHFLMEKYSVLHIGQVWNDEFDVVKEKMRITIDEISFEDLLHLNFGELITISNCYLRL